MNTTSSAATNPVTLQLSADGSSGLISFTIFRGEFHSEESLEELLTLLAGLSHGVVGVVRQHLPGARVEVGVHQERMTNHYVLGEVFRRAHIQWVNRKTPLNFDAVAVQQWLQSCPAGHLEQSARQQPGVPDKC